MNRYKLVISLLVTLALTGCMTDYKQQTSAENAKTTLSVVAALDKGPGNLTITPSGELIISLHQFYNHELRVARVANYAQITPYAEAAGVNSVLGLQADVNGIVWLLDNALRNGDKRRLVGWHDAENRVVVDIDLTSVTHSDSFLNDLAVDPSNDTVYIADPASGENAAIIVVNISRGIARRVLEGHNSVKPEDLDLIIDNMPVRIRNKTGREIRPRIGINPIALDKDGKWLYYGPMHGHSMYRIKTKELRNEKLALSSLSGRVDRWSEKPICDGISIDNAGNIYLGDLANNAVGVIGQDRLYRVLIADPRLSWVDAFSFGPNNFLYLVANQLHRSKILNGGELKTELPYLILKFEALSEGTIGR